MNGNGIYDGPDDMNIRWCDINDDGVPNVQAFPINPKEGELMPEIQTGNLVWLVWKNHDQCRGLGWINWKKFNFDSGVFPAPAIGYPIITETMKVGSLYPGIMMLEKKSNGKIKITVEDPTQKL
ncbi:MAG: hypothetical protein Q8904_01750 [Bacteroidota bacterium]|nr:hypothetical protein [Bacteroidota bacterium]